MLNSTTDSLKQSLEALSANMAAHGMSINLMPVAPNEYTPAMNEEEEIHQKSCVEITPDKKPVPFIFEKPTGFQGYMDPFFPYPKKYQSRYYPNSNFIDSIYTRDTTCSINSPFRVYNDNQDPEPDYQILCSNDIYNILKAHSVPTLMYLDCNMGHGLDNTCDTCYCPTNFGATWAYTKDQVNEYLASRAAFFFQAIMNGTAGSLGGYSRFFNCEDMRYSADTCSTAANNACTTNLPCNQQ